MYWVNRIGQPRFNIDFTPCVEIGWRLVHKYWGNGFATEAANACLDYGFRALKLDEILSFTSVLNLKSIKEMKKIGMGYVKSFSPPSIGEGHRLRDYELYKNNATP